MRKIILALLGAIAMSSTYAQNWLPIRYENQNVKGIPFSKVRFKKGETKETIFGKDMQVTLSEKPDGVESGYYVVHARNGYIAIGDKKNKIEVGSDKLIRTSDGWYEYDFGKTLYVRKIGMFVGTEHCAPIYVLSTDGSVASSSMSSSTSLSNTNQATSEVIPPLKMLTPHSPAEEGWTLTQTHKISDDITREDYVKEVDDDEIHLYLYKKNDGSFCTSKEEYDILVTKDRYDFDDGDYNWTLNNGIHALRQDKIKQTKYPNGNIVQKIGEKEYLYLPNIPNEGYAYTEIETDLMHANNHIFLFRVIDDNKGYLIKDRFYTMDKMGNLTHMYQKVNGKYYWACPTDTIIEVKYATRDTTREERWNPTGKINTCEFIYKNGDRYKLTNTFWGGKERITQGEITHAGTLHRKRGILKYLKSGEISYRLNDGSKFIYHNNRLYYVGEGILSEEDPEFTNGVLVTSDGKQENYTDGKSDTKRSKEIEDNIAKKRAEEKAERDRYIKKYGYYPGDGSSIKEVLKTGRKFGAIEEYFSASIVRDRGAEKQYKVVYNTWGGYAYVWVRNGIITSVTY